MGAFEDQLRHQVERLTGALGAAEKELAQQRQADARLRAQHHNDYGLCAACTGSHGVPWPCPTIHVLNGDAA